jgi:allantoate deiminase
MQRCDTLAGFSEEPERLTRRFATPALRQAGEAVMAWMRAAGMSVRQDSVGNVIGRYEAIGDAAAGAKTLLLGSHLDSVRDAGRYDGPLGVLVALAAVQRLHDARRRLPYAIEVLGFADEEGTRYGTAYLGSKVVAGTFDPAYLRLVDDEGIAMADAIRAFGGDPDRLADDRRAAGDLLAYCEIHIEQGPVLEARGLPVGVVTAIAGQSRMSVGLTGVAGHAGTVPMELRRDALCAAAELVLAVEALARATPGLVATVGQLAAAPGASNVIPGHVVLSLDVRHQDDPARLAAVARLREAADLIAERRAVAVHWQVLQENDALACDPALAGRFARAIEGCGYQSHALPSGAGHDCVALAALAGVAMLFVRCKGGVSHNPAESVEVADVAVAIDVLARFLDLLAAEIPAR